MGGDCFYISRSYRSGWFLSSAWIGPMGTFKYLTDAKAEAASYFDLTEDQSNLM